MNVSEKEKIMIMNTCPIQLVNYLSFISGWFVLTKYLLSSFRIHFMRLDFVFFFFFFLLSTQDDLAEVLVEIFACFSFSYFAIGSQNQFFSPIWFTFSCIISFLSLFHTSCIASVVSEYTCVKLKGNIWPIFLNFLYWVKKHSNLICQFNFLETCKRNRILTPSLRFNLYLGTQSKGLFFQRMSFETLTYILIDHRLKRHLLSNKIFNFKIFTISNFIHLRFFHKGLFDTFSI